MGRTIKALSSKPVGKEAIFDKRFVIEVCEEVHFHYRNLRITLNLEDFLEMSRGCSQALERWEKLGKPQCAKGTHVELVRKQVPQKPLGEPSIRVNHNQNLYKMYQGRMFSEGTEFNDDTYVHLKIRDMRLEMPLSEFKALAEAVKDADGKLEDCYSDSVQTEA